MEIDAVELFLVSMPLLSSRRASRAHGWGESSPLATPTYSPEFVQSCLRQMESDPC